MSTTAVVRPKTLDLVYISLFAVLLALCAWITIPTLVPFTLQTLGVFLTGSLLGPRRGLAALLVYLLLGLVGLPIFAGFNSGPGVLLGPTGGYLLGFLVGVPLIGLAAKPGKTWVLALGMLAALLLCYAFGTAWFMVVYAQKSGAVGLLTVLGWCVFPFIIPDLLKLGLALALSRRLRPYMKA